MIYIIDYSNYFATMSYMLTYLIVHDNNCNPS